MSAPDTLSTYLDGRTRPLELWWRDDDLETPSPALSVCLEALSGAGITAAFAAIPSGLTAGAVETLTGTGSVLFVHGWTHTNHAPPGDKKCEFGTGRPLPTRLAEIARGRERVQALGGGRAIACFVPPWNRLGDDLLPTLGRAGISALSAFAAPTRSPPPATVPRLDTHVDLIDWRGTGGAISDAEFVERLLQHDGVDGPVGILSHHRVTEPGAWATWRPILKRLDDHPAARWLTPVEALGRVGVDLGERRIG
ncbi:MAG: polysaccharide deacetylase family protein [Thalassobaculaceae bacterium]|nr:polysaccharide deacetylase family protein [Thalassobaculaceae bacterium]